MKLGKLVLGIVLGLVAFTIIMVVAFCGLCVACADVCANEYASTVYMYDDGYVGVNAKGETIFVSSSMYDVISKTTAGYTMIDCRTPSAFTDLTNAIVDGFKEGMAIGLASDIVSYDAYSANNNAGTSALIAAALAQH